MKIGGYGIKTASASAGLGPMSIEASGTATNIRRGKLLMFSVGCSDPPAAHTITIQIQRQTVTGTGTTLAAGTAPVPMDPGDLIADSLTVWKQTLTVTPTITAGTVLFKRSFSTQYGFDFFAVPGAEIIWPAAAANGIVWDTPIAANADNLTLYAQIDEL